MHVVPAIAHIFGAVTAVFVLAFGIAVLMAWIDERNRKIAHAEIALALNIPITAIDDPENEDAVLKFVTAHFNSELLRNRVSDICGWVHTAWDWLGVLLQVGVLGGVLWYTITEDVEYSIQAWWIVAIAGAFSATSLVFTLACNVLTGRYPGQAKKARAFVADAMAKRAERDDQKRTGKDEVLGRRQPSAEST